MLENILGIFWGSSSEKRVKKWRGMLEKVNALSSTYEAFDDSKLQAMTATFKERIDAGESEDDIMYDAFATVREAARRTLGMYHFDVQILGGIALHKGMIAEIKTGEGKTLVATLPVYLNALSGKGVHVVTVNDYLATRDEGWMRPLYNFLGLSSGVVSGKTEHHERRMAYEADITYATNNELGFDFLRDNMKYSLASMLHRGYNFAIVDEVDSILIDEARTPLIISGTSSAHTPLYQAVHPIMTHLEDVDVDIDEKTRNVTLTDHGIEKVEQFLVGLNILEEGQSIFDPQHITTLHHVTQCVRAHRIYVRDRDYIVRNDSIVIIDEFTGRMMPNRRFSDGLHQALEAKESVTIQPESVTVASVTFQNYFRMYNKLSGMTGTAVTEKEEFEDIYGLDVVVIPTNIPVIRDDNDDKIYASHKEKYDAVVSAVEEAQAKGQPVLIGTTSIDKSNDISTKLKDKGIEHCVLNALYHEQEAHIISQAGVPGKVTVATNMAGRGTDIRLGGNLEEALNDQDKYDGMSESEIVSMKDKIINEYKDNEDKVRKSGGLRILGTERHESRRIDNQLRGRAGRQGDPGSTTFFLSLEDDLMRIFGSARIQTIIDSMGGLPEGEPIVHPWVSKAVAKAQTKIEARNFDIRKTLLRFDDVVNHQRWVVFDERYGIVASKDLSGKVTDMRHEAIDALVENAAPSGMSYSQWDLGLLEREAERIFGVTISLHDICNTSDGNAPLAIKLKDEAEKQVSKNTENLDKLIIHQIAKIVMLDEIDSLWAEHLVFLEHLRQIISLRGYGQKDPLHEYKKESFSVFQAMLVQLNINVTEKMMKVSLSDVRHVDSPEREGEHSNKSTIAELHLPIGFKREMILHTLQDLEENDRIRILNALGIRITPTHELGVPPSYKRNAQDENNSSPDYQGSSSTSIPRNSTCPCGSGKRYKHCHGRVV